MQAVLTTLGERLPSGLADHMAAQLPPEPADSIRQATDSSAEGPAALSTERFGMARGTRRRARSGTHGGRGRGTPADIRVLLPAGRTAEDSD